MKKMILMVFLVLGLMSVPAFAGVYDFEMLDIDGQSVSLSKFEGKAVLIVNTASRCGFTKQYKPLEALYQQYKDSGLEILAFPANNFGGQEPGSNDEIKNFCFLNFKTTFPLFAKSSVKGDDISPLYQYLTEQSPFPGAISWNFNKFLVDSQGNVVARFGSRVDPLDDELVSKLKEILPQNLEN